jgi:hypothetical protein
MKALTRGRLRNLIILGASGTRHAHKKLQAEKYLTVFSKSLQLNFELIPTEVVRTIVDANLGEPNAAFAQARSPLDYPSSGV